jgi:hypothetical protein
MHRLYDILFIILALAVLLPLVELGHGEIIQKFSFIFMLTAYFAGKYVKGKQQAEKAR